MSSISDEDKNQTNDINFRSENIIRRDNREMFTRVEGAEQRQKQSEQEKAKLDRTKKNFAKAAHRAQKRAEQKAKSEARKLKNKARNEKLKEMLWTGKNKKRTIIVVVFILVALLAYPVYLGGSTLIENIIATVEKEAQRKEEEELLADPANYANTFLMSLRDKFQNESFEAGKEYFEREIEKNKDEKETLLAIYRVYATEIKNYYGKDKIDVALEAMLYVEEESPSSDSAVLLYEIYKIKGDTTLMQQWLQIYQERIEEIEAEYGGGQG